MVNFVICILTNLFRVYLIYKYIKIFAKESMPKHNWEKSKRGLAFLMYFLVNIGCHLAFHSAWVNLTVNIFGIFLLASMYHKSFKKSLFIGCSIYLIDIICDTVATLPFVEYKYGREINEFYAVITVFLLFLCVLLTEKIVTYRKDGNTEQNLPLAMMLVPMSSIATFGLLMYVKSSSQTVLLIVSIGFLFINFLLLYLYNMLLKSFAQHYENETLKREIQVYMNQIEIILQNEENINLLKHDMKHHLNELKLLAAKRETSDILEYIEDMEVFMRPSGEIVSSGNVEIDSLLNYMLQRAKKSLCSVNAKIQIPEEISHSFDINIILGNLLENAIEAAEKTEDKILDVEIGLKQGVLKIKIENSFSGIWIPKKVIEKGQFFTTKGDQEKHGFGLKSVRKIVEKYHGVMKINPDGKCFCVKIILYLPEKD